MQAPGHGRWPDHPIRGRLTAVQNLQAVLALTFPFFALVLCGYVATRRIMMPVEAIPGLSAFVLYFALPAMLFRFGAATPLAQLFDFRLIVLYSTCSILLVSGTVLASRNERIGLRDAAFGALVAAFPNSGFMGIPLIVALLGEQSVGVVIVTILVDFFLTSSICLSIARMQRVAGEPRHWPALARALARSLRGAAYNPMPWAIAIGALYGWSGLTMPEPAGKTISLLADAASPAALFTIGAILARNAVRAKHGSPLVDYLPIALAKLFVHPLLIFIAGRLAMEAGFAFDAQTLTAVTLVAALPSASNVSMLAERYGVDSDRIARIILASTATSFVTFSGMVWLLGVQPPS